jgi:RNA polymerase primary sigma factor
MTAQESRELALVAQVIAGDKAALDHFVDLAGPPIWSAVRLVEGEGAAGESAFLRALDALKAQDWRRLKAFDGRSSLATWLALHARQALIDELPLAFASAPAAAWRRFERIFSRDIQRRIARRFPRADAAAREDVLQEVRMRLVEDDCRRLSAFASRGSFEGFVLTLVDRLLIDLLRREMPRRRLPAEVQRLGELAQAVFRLAAWEHAPMQPARLLERLVAPGRNLDVAEVGAALEQVREAVEAERARRAFGREAPLDAPEGHGSVGVVLPSAERGPEGQLIEQRRQADQEALIAAITKSARQWPEEERLYLQTFLFSGAPPREIARMMGAPVETIRQIQQRTLRRMREIARTMEITSVSVLGIEE